MPEKAAPSNRIWNLKTQRWLIPLAIGALGIGYVLWEGVQQGGRPLFAEETVMGLLLLGVIAPTIAFATLTWAVEGADYWEAANQELESRVAERTRELERAKRELAEKAETLREVLAAERLVEEKTRTEIAMDLHDGVQQLIVGALFEIQSARDAAVQNPRILPVRLSAIQDLLQRITVEMRRAIYSLHPLALDAQGLVPAIRECVEQFERVSGIGSEFVVAGAPRRIAPEVEIAMYRIAQEALNNAGAHAQSRRVRVGLNFDEGDLTLRVSDDGVGFDVRAIQERVGAHLGLIGMRERAASVGGYLEITSRPGEGTSVALKVPVEPLSQSTDRLRVG